VSDTVIEIVAAKELIELRRRELAYRSHATAPEVSGKTIILVDDGIATGSTICAAIAALHKQRPARIVVAAPTAPPSFRKALGADVDEVVVITKPKPFHAVGQVYEVFGQTSDEEVHELLTRSKQCLQVSR